MAVKPLSPDVRYQGLSSDPKPGGSDGAVFHVIDTGEEFICHEGIWSVDLRGMDPLNTDPTSVQLLDEGGLAFGVRHTANRPHVTPYVWNSSTLAYEAATQTTITTGSLTVSGTMDLTKIGGVNVGVDNALAVKPGTGASFPVTGAFYPDTQPVSATSLPLPSGAATSAKQDTGIAYQATLESLVETLQELAARLAVLSSWASSGAPGMRVVGVSMPSTVVTGPQTSAQFIATYAVAGINYTSRTAIENTSAVLANINNVTAA